jgi:hypothetical protein
MTFPEFANWVPLPAPVTTGTAVQTFTDPTGDVWVAKNGVNSGAWKKARDALHVSYRRVAAFNVPTTTGAIGMDTVENDPFGLYNPATGICTVPVAGMWAARFTIVASPTASGQFLQATLAVTGGSAVPAYAPVQSSSTVGLTAHVFATRLLPVGGTFTTQGNASVVMVGAVGTSGAYCGFTADYLGTG